MNKNVLRLSLFFMLLVTQTAFAQSDLDIFGFAQIRVKQQDGEYSLKTNAFGGTTSLDGQKSKFISGSVQQMNLFLRKELSENITGWVNFEVLNNYSSDRKWGGINLEEAWVSYQYSDAFTVKGGLLVPRFNHLNEIKNRMPLLPYITRPLIFEPTLKNIATPWHYLPERAFLQVSGNLPTEQVTLDYAVYVGNSETKYSNTDPSIAIETGSDSVDFKMVGGRVGVKYGSFYLGVSTTFDKANYQATLKENVDRNRIGFDFGGSYKNAFVEAEYIKVHLDPEKATGDFDKSFYYATAGYNFSEETYAYASYSQLKDAESIPFKDGLSGLIVGAGYKPIPTLVLKAEFSSYYTKSDVMAPLPGGIVVPAKVDIDFKTIQIAASFLF